MFRGTFILGLVVVAAAGCARTVKGEYVVGLASVERPPAAVAAYGEQRVFRTGEGTETYYFDDDMVEVQWTVGEDNFHVTLTNKTEKRLSIVWDEAEYVDENGAVGGVIHSGVLLSDLDKPQEPTPIAPGKKTDQQLIPKSKIYFDSGVYATWRQHPLLPPPSGDASANVGKRVSVRLPMALDGVVTTYVFLFEVNGIVGQ